MKLRIAIALACALTSAPGLTWAQRGGEAFQGLRWGDSISAIQQKFPAAKVDRLCDGEYFLDLPIFSSCTTVKFYGYEVAGLKFEITFFLSGREKALSGLELKSFSANLTGLLASAVCTKFEGMLSSRYGKKYVLPEASPSDQGRVQVFQWNESDGASQVQMTCSTRNDGVRVLINYMPKFHQDSEKL